MILVFRGLTANVEERGTSNWNRFYI